ncbi:MAG TPA: hypothetical protein VLK89_00770 [Solirubrobacterales bacterium]|nr:hypothetical protein [Solirubrobacterales bacterium]
MTTRRIEWSSAEVDAVGTLTVAIVGEVDDIWMDGLIRTLDWMEGESRTGGWGQISYGPETFRVENVSEDSVAALQQFLNDAVRHANGAADHDRGAALVDEHRDIDLGPEAARRMTDEFRA